MSGDHDPTAADVLDARFPYDPFRCCGPVDMPSEILAALSAAGLSVVRTGEVPAWMEPATYTDGKPVSLYSPENPAGRPLYVLRPKENQ